LSFLQRARGRHNRQLLFPAEDGSQRAPDAALHKVLRRALGRARLVDGYNHVCRRKGCG
jgi:integrase